jgi:hypothetical protein
MLLTVAHKKRLTHLQKHHFQWRIFLSIAKKFHNIKHILTGWKGSLGECQWHWRGSIFFLKSKKKKKKKYVIRSDVFFMRHPQWRPAIFSINIWYLLLEEQGEHVQKPPFPQQKRDSRITTIFFLIVAISVEKLNWSTNMPRK